MSWLAQRDAVFLRQTRHHFRKLLRQICQKESMEKLGMNRSLR